MPINASSSSGDVSVWGFCEVNRRREAPRRSFRLIRDLGFLHHPLPLIKLKKRQRDNLLLSESLIRHGLFLDAQSSIYVLCQPINLRQEEKLREL
ncbi:unnamed protein product [Arabis nemorensis]|uniref:Uncharacterized protein n=1 Tax=Arabis nemorensis TaxID=586526 RepID=A0A565CCT8_9BRAS|nr:unnamed protein product [Arabis nemorensis]